MTIDHNLEFLYERDGDRYPVLRLRVDGVHDVGRVLATLARGNCEHAHVAYAVGRELNRTWEGRATLAYLERHGGPKLGPSPCEACTEGVHRECDQVLHPDDPIDGAVCGCYEADEPGHTRAAMSAPMGIGEGERP